MKTPGGFHTASVLVSSSSLPCWLFKGQDSIYYCLQLLEISEVPRVKPRCFEKLAKFSLPGFQSRCYGASHPQWLGCMVWALLCLGCPSHIWFPTVSPPLHPSSLASLCRSKCGRCALPSSDVAIISWFVDGRR